MRSSTALIWLALAATACTGREDRAAPARGLAGVTADAGPAAADLDHPLAALQMTADEAASRLGSLDYEATVGWAVSKNDRRVRMTERHRVRQLATGEFEASVDLDPGQGPGAESGRQVIWVGGMTYARGRWAPFRERPTDRGRDARRFRDESFRMAADVAALCSGALRAEPVGETTRLGRRASLYALSTPPAGPIEREEMVGPPLPDGGVDEDTRRRFAFLHGAVPLSLQGQLALDAETGAPLSVRLRATFGEKDDLAVRAELDLVAQVKVLGAAVGRITAPRALPDERKPRGVARALESAGLRRRPGEEQRPDEEAEEE